MSEGKNYTIKDGEISDGYHTFSELYKHRNMLMLALMAELPSVSWFAAEHADGTMFPGWFIAGINLTTGQITYHLPIEYWCMAIITGAGRRTKAPEWDGHTPADVLKRLERWIEGE